MWPHFKLQKQDINMNNYKTKIIGLSALLLSTQSYAVTFSLSPSATNLTLGESLSIDVNVSDVTQNTAIGNYDLDVGFNSSVLNIGEGQVAFGTQLQQLGISSLKNISLEGGVLNISEVSHNDAKVLNSLQSDEFTVATLDFTTTNTGTSPLNVLVNSVGNQDGRRIKNESLLSRVVKPESIRVHDLSSLPAQQKDSWKTLNRICRGNALSVEGGESSSNRRDLANISCQLTHGPDLENNDLESALQNIAAEESNIISNMAVRTVTQNTAMVRTRLAQRRSHNGSMISSDLIGGGAGDDTSLGMSERLSGFVNASGHFGETDETENEVGTTFNKEDVTLGVDYQFNEQFVSGLAFTYSHANANVQKSASVSGGKMAEQGYTGTIYSSYYVDNFYLDGIFSYTKRDYDLDRNIVIASQNLNRKATADTESDQYSASLALGYNWNSHGVDVSPYAQVSYSRLEIDSYSERGAQGLNLNVGNQNIDSLESVVGVQLAYAWSQSFGVLRPYVNAEWHHEFKEDTRAIKTSYANDINSAQNILQLRNDGPDRDFATIGVGVSGVFKESIQAFTAFEALVGQSNTSSYQFTVGVRLAF